MGQSSTKFTNGRLRNNSGHTLSLVGSKVWEGSQPTVFPKTIVNGDVGGFAHSAGPDEGSIAALVYKILADDTKWVVAWSNPRGRDSMVFVDITDQPVDWDDVKNQLNSKGKAKYETKKFGYRLGIELDPEVCSPTMLAYWSFSVL